MERIILLHETAKDFLHDLIDNLFHARYFGFKEGSRKYVKKLTRKIYSYIPIRKHFETPSSLRNLSPHFIHIQSSKKTTWFIFFDQIENRILITSIINNHFKEAGNLNQ